MRALSEHIPFPLLAFRQPEKFLYFIQRQQQLRRRRRPLRRASSCRRHHVLDVGIIRGFLGARSFDACRA